MNENVRNLVCEFIGTIWGEEIKEGCSQNLITQGFGDVVWSVPNELKDMEIIRLATEILEE